MKFIQGLPSNPVAWIFMAIIAIVALRLAYRSTPQKVIKCYVNSNKLITNRQSKFNKLNILYDNKQVEKLIVSDLTFWNNSFPTIKKEDLIKKCPFTVSIENGEILDVVILDGENSPNQIDASILDKNTVSISFEYLDRKEGGKIQIIHTGNEESIVVSKKIQGGKIKDKSDITNFVLREFVPGLIISFGLYIVLLFACWSLTVISKEDFIISIIFILILSITIMVMVIKRIIFIPSNCKKVHKKNK